MKIRNIYGFIVVLISLMVLKSCGIYSFVGTSIKPDIKTISVAYIENKALKVNPALSNLITEELTEKYRKFTKLDLVNMDADLEVSGEITGYDVKSMGVTADEVASKTRLTVHVKITFINNKYPEEDFEKDFSSYQEYDSSMTLDQAEGQIIEDIVETLAEDIFNATVANW